MVEINDYCGKNYIKHSSTIGRFPWIEGKGLYLCKGPDYRKPEIKISAPFRYARRMASYLKFFSDNWLFCTCGLDFFRPRHVLI